MGGESITRSCSAQNEGAGLVIKLGEVIMILDLHRQGLTVSAIARELGIDRKTVRKCIARGLEPPVYGPRKPPAPDRSIRFLFTRAGDGLSRADRGLSCTRTCRRFCAAISRHSRRS